MENNRKSNEISKRQLRNEQYLKKKQYSSVLCYFTANNSDSSCFVLDIRTYMFISIMYTHLYY